MAKQITCEIVKPIEALSENDKGYTKEVTLVSWNNAAAKALLFRKARAES